jgi:radical SAM protein with 4Fe4S-binding SPASM domain
MAPVNTGHYGYGGGKMTRIFARYVGGCGAGRAYCAIQPNGDVTPCVFMPIKVGSLRTDPFETAWNHPVMQLLRDRDDREGHCRTCDYKFNCGGCRARSWGYFRDLRQPDPGRGVGCVAHRAAGKTARRASTTHDFNGDGPLARTGPVAGRAHPPPMPAAGCCRARGLRQLQGGAGRTCGHAVLAPREHTGGRCGAGRTCEHLAPGVFTGG